MSKRLENYDIRIRVFRAGYRIDKAATNHRIGSA